MLIRIPQWTSGVDIRLNGEPLDDVSAEPGTYAKITRDWVDGDTITIRLPMSLYTVPANDRPDLAAIAYGPVILSGIYGDENLTTSPTIALDTVQKSEGGTFLDFQATADNETVKLGPFYNAQGFNYNVYWVLSGALPERK